MKRTKKEIRVITKDRTVIVYVHTERRISLSTIRVFPGSIHSTTDSSHDDTGFR